MSLTTRSFPDGFLWGTATAAHQVEGGNWNNDWWLWEHTPGSPCVEPSGDACDHFHRYPDDLALTTGLGFGSYRFSVEWSRIEPEPGEFSTAALDHYLRMIRACREHDLEPVVTLHHFTTPRWAAATGGWTEPETAERFSRFVTRTVSHLAPELTRVCTINEPNIVTRLGYQLGVFPPGERDPRRRLAADQVMLEAHRLAVEAVRRETDARVGLTLAMSDHQAVAAGGEGPRDAERAIDEDVYLEAARTDDFVGVQTYTRVRYGPGGALGPEPGVELTLMGYEFYPEALEGTIRRAHEVAGVPVLVTENGVAVDDDARRVEYVRRALGGVLDCLDDGLPVEGYTYWSALDNFEWAFGYGPTFGLIAVDRTTQVRNPRPSAAWLGEVARANAL